MESPVRICLGAALVVNLLLLNGITVNGNTLPRDTTSTTTREERIPTRTRSKTPDASLNELNSKIKPKVSTSEENAKYKDRGRGNVKFHSQIRATTEGSRQRARTEPPHIIIVTPTPEVKKPADIVDSMRIYKKTKLPNLVSSTTPVTVTEEEYEDDISQDDDYGSEENDSIESDEKYTAGFDKYFTMPSFGFNHDNEFGSSSKKVKEEFNVPSYGGFSSVFPHKVSYGYAEPTHDSFKAEYFNYHGELTTPTNDFFDKKYYQVSSSIIKNLDAIKAKTAPPNATDVQKIMKHDLDMKKLSNSSLPGNKSTVFIKNTKEIRLLDNDDANSANKELSDVHGTSIYYEMSVLSTETYAINSDVDCDDNDTLSSGTTPSTIVEESESINTAQKVLPENTTPVYPEPSPESLSTVSSNYLPVSSVLPVYNTINPVAVSTQNSVSSTEKTRIFTSNFSRNWNYSKRLNLNGNRDSPNSVTTKPVIISSSLSPRYQTRKFYHSTPKSKPVWMVPRRNITRIRPTVSSPIYSEHFSINPRTTARPRLSSPFFNRLANNVLTTVSSDIDPVLQGDIGGLKKVVQSQSISDNTVPNLSKRGSTKFGTSATSATDAESEMPPTAWALASLRVPPPSPDPAVNSTVSQKNVDENELQNVGEGIDKKETATDSTASTSANPISNDIIPKKINEVVQNKFEWQAMIVPTSSAETQTETQPPKILSNKSDQSNLSAQNSVEEESFTTKVSKITEETTETFWVPVDKEDDTTDRNYIEKETIPPVDATKSTGFESITKLPADITTPQDESVASSEVNQTITDEKPKRKVPTDYEITTIRFSYVPNEEVTTSGIESDPTETIVPSTWHPVFPTRTRITTLKDTPITTYRPKYTSAEMEDETTTTFIDTTSQIEVSSQVLESATKILDETTEMPTQTTELPTESTIMIQESTITQKESTITQKEGSITQKESTITQKESTITQKETTPPIADEFTTQSTIVEFTTESATTLPEMATTREVPTTFTPEYEDITTTSAEVKTEINTKKEEIILTATDKSSETTEMSSSEPQSDFTEESSGSNEVITQETVKPSTTESPTTKSIPMTMRTTTEVPVQLSTEIIRQTTTQRNAQMFDTTVSDTAVGTEYTTQVGNALEELTSYATEMTTESSSRVLGDDDPGSGAAVAIAVSTIGVIALILLIGLLLVVRRRGRRGVYAQRCTPVSLDAYSLDSVSVGHRKGNQRLRASKRSYGNPAYDDEVTSHPMKYAALANFALDVESMTAEFAEIPSVTVRPDEVPPGCEDKNRYSNVLPLPETRVPLKRIGNDPTTEYINANYVSGPGNIKNYYIACQAPMANTVTDFWRMIWEQNSRLVIMLTEYMENGVEKCYEYLPPSEISDNKRTFGDYRIILKKREQRDKYALSTILLINLATRTSRDIVHLWYFWPAKGVPDDYDSVIDFLCEMRSYMKIMQTAKEYDEEASTHRYFERDPFMAGRVFYRMTKRVAVIYGDQNSSSVQNLSKLKSEENTSNNGVNMYSPAKAEEQMRRVTNNNGTLGRMKAASEVEGIRPCVVLCASGAGRAAALIALDICARALPGAADVPRVVRHLRAQRPHSLTNKHHYIFVYKVLSEYGNKMLGGGVDTI